MSFDINSVVLVGRLTRDPELRYSQSGMAITKFGLAVGGKKSTQNQDDGDDNVSFFDVVVFGKMAEVCNQYCSKGKMVAIQGSLNQNRWQNQEGQNRSKVEILANQVQFLSSGSGSNRVEPDNQYGYSNPPQQRQATNQHPQKPANMQQPKPRTKPADLPPDIDDDVYPDSDDIGDIDGIAY